MTDLFLKILNMSIAASYLVMAVVAVRLILKKAPRWISVLLWGIVALRLMWPFSIESILSLIPSTQTVSPEILLAPEPSINSGIPALNATINPILGQALAPTPSASVNPAQVLIAVISAAWVAGMIGMALYALVSYWRLRHRVATAVRVRDNIYCSEYVTSPFILGLVKPRIYLPFGLGERELSHILAHEQTHIRQKDHWWKPLGFLLLVIHWFNPLMWLAYSLLCRDIEQACDEKVIRTLEKDQRADYSQTLLKCSVSRRAITACPLAFGEVDVKERVKNVLNYKKPAFWIVVVGILVCVVVAVCFLTDPVTSAQEKDPQQNEPPSVQNVPGPAKFFYPISMMTEEWKTGTFQLEAFPDVSFRWGDGKVEAVTKKGAETLVEVQTIYILAAADLNLDGYPEVCVTAGTAAGGEFIVVYDYMAKKSHMLSGDPSQCIYYLYNRDGYLMCAMDALESDGVEKSGRLLLTGDALAISAPWQVAEYDGNAVIWYDKNDPDSPDRGQAKLDAFPGVVFRWNYRPNVIDAAEGLVMVKNGVETELFHNGHGNTISVYVADITGDGKPDICANVYYMFSGLTSYNAVFVYDYAKDAYYDLACDSNMSHDTTVSYYVRLDGEKLVCDKIHVATSQTLATGILRLTGGDDKQLVLEVQILHDNPVEYIFIGEHTWWDRVTLTVCADGTCDVLFNPRLNADGTSNRARGTYVASDGKLVMTTEEGEVYTFRVFEDDLVFLAEESDALPEGCPMYDGAVLVANPFFPN